MKTTIYNKACMAMITLVIFTSCNDLFDSPDVNKNPNVPLINQIGAEPLTTGAQVGIGLLYEDTDNRIASMWAGQLSGQSRQHLTYQNYTVSAGTFVWVNYYNVGKNVRLIQQKLGSTSRVHLGVAQVMEALVFYKLTTLWGDVPYSEAFDDVKFPKPKFDTQASILTKLTALLDVAVTNLNSGVGKVSGDFYYHNDPILWAAAAKSLQARIYLLQKNYPAAATAAASGIASPADDMLTPHGTAQQVDLNLNYDFFVNARPGDTSFDAPSFIPTFMLTNYETGVTSTTTARRNSKTNETAFYRHFFLLPDDDNSITGGLDPNVYDGAYQINAPSPVLTYYETQLILAEALARQSNGADANANGAIAALNNVRTGLATGEIFGLKSAYPGLQYLPYNVADLLVGGTLNPAAGPNAGKTAQQALLTEIASEKFIITLGQFEAFNDLRRFQMISLPGGAVNIGIPKTSGKTQFPARFVYPQNELNTNPNTPNPPPDQFTKLAAFQ